MSAYFDISGMVPPLSVPRTHRNTARFGDRAIIYAYLSLWKRTNPDRSLVLLEDKYGVNVESYARLTKWIAEELKAEYRLVEEEVLTPDLSCSLPLNTDSLWARWKAIRHELAQPLTPRLEAAAQQRSADMLKRWNLKPGQYVTLHPMLKTGYNHWRERSISYWEALVEQLGRVAPVVVVGGDDCGSLSPPRAGVYHAFKESLDVVESVALVAQSAVHVGGETGLTFWATLLRTPTVALYGQQGYEYLPIGFGSPLVIVAEQSKVPAIQGLVRDLSKDLFSPLVQAKRAK